MNKKGTMAQQEVESHLKELIEAIARVLRAIEPSKEKSKIVLLLAHVLEEEYPWLDIGEWVARTQYGA